MESKTIAVDLAKSAFEVAVSRRRGQVAGRHRLSRGHDEAAVALANKLARIVWAVSRRERAFETSTTQGER